MVMMSPSFTRASGPPTTASGDAWPIISPCDAPENLPSVIERHGVLQTLPHYGRGDGEHLAHPGPSLRPLVADYHDVAGDYLLVHDRVVGVLLPVEDPRGTPWCAPRRARGLEHAPLGGQVASQYREPARLSYGVASVWITSCPVGIGHPLEPSLRSSLPSPS